MTLQSSSILLPFLLFYSFASSFHNNGNTFFSLSEYQRARAEETCQTLDASRFHFQILFVDNNNFHGRIVEGIMARVAEYNDAIFTLFPTSATLDSSSKAPLDAAAPDAALAICNSLGLCSTRSTAMGTSFDLSFLDEYDLVIAMDDEIRTQILRSLDNKNNHYQEYYGAKCRLLSEFLSLEFCNIQHYYDKRQSSSSKNNKDDDNNDDQLLLNMLDSDLYEHVAPFYEMVKDSSSSLFSTSVDWNDVYQPRMILSQQQTAAAAVPNPKGWPKIEAGMILATAGLTRFCQDTINAQMEHAFQTLLEQHFCRKEHLEFTFRKADAQLQKGSYSVSGYFSPQQRQTRFEQHLERLRLDLLDNNNEKTTTTQALP